jgi:hypothetical protein
MLVVPVALSQSCSRVGRARRCPCRVVVGGGCEPSVGVALSTFGGSQQARRWGASRDRVFVQRVLARTTAAVATVSLGGVRAAWAPGRVRPCHPSSGKGLWVTCWSGET